MKLYELSFLVTPEIKEDSAKQISQNLISSLQEKGITLDNLENIRFINLAYKIGKKSQAYFLSFSFFANPNNIADLEKELKNNKDILRYLIVFKKKQRTSARFIRREIRRPAAKRKTIGVKTSIEQIEEKLDEILEKGIEEEIK
jgi:ribosomal protein S6